TSVVRPSTSPTRSRSRASPSTTRTPAVPAPAATRSTDRLRPTEEPLLMDLEDLRAVSYTATQTQVLLSYRAGLLPMGVGVGGPGRMGCWAPRRRGVLLPGDLRVTKSLRQSMKHFTFTSDRAFEQVIRACADPNRPGAWITEEIIALYLGLHSDGWAHSVEVWAADELVGGLYGVAIGSFFAGESMFHTRRDASKAALAHLVSLFEGADEPADEEDTDSENSSGA